MSYIAQSDLESLLSQPVVLAIYDDQNAGSVNQTVLNEILNLASGLVDGALAKEYPGPFPISQQPVPQLIKMATLLFAKALSYDRHPEYQRQYSTLAWKQANDFMQGVVAAKEYINDLMESPVPANAGGLIYNTGPRMIIDQMDGSDSDGDF